MGSATVYHNGYNNAYEYYRSDDNDYDGDGATISLLFSYGTSSGQVSLKFLGLKKVLYDPQEQEQEEEYWKRNKLW